METGKDQQRPIIIIKKKVRHAAHHGGAWKVALADFMTAMMAFFLVMWIISQNDEVKQGIGGYFRDPVGFSEKVGMGVMDGSRSIMKLPRPGAGMSDAERHRQREISRLLLKKTGQEIITALLALPGLSDAGDQIEVELTDEGLRIRVMESKDSTFFNLGSADLAPRGMAVFATIARGLTDVDNEIIIEGYTDSHKFPTQDYTNWELASDRANTARRILELNGVDSEKIVQVRSFSDNKLRYPDRPEDPGNRRVTILVLNRYAIPRVIDMGERQVMADRDSKS